LIYKDIENIRTQQDETFVAYIYITIEALHENCIGQLFIKPIYAANDQLDKINDMKAQKQKEMAEKHDKHKKIKSKFLSKVSIGTNAAGEA
jgi:hypothetical protein